MALREAIEEITYENLLARMRQRFETESGVKPDDASDIGIRLKVLAAELFAALASLRWLGRQAFPQTAQGKELDLHAEQRGISRQNSVKASGGLTFGRGVPLPYDVMIPKATVCAAGNAIGNAGGQATSPTEYETTSDAVLPAGILEIHVPAQAVDGGTAGNASAGFINTLVTPPVGIETVTNAAPFTGGQDSESDESLRNRLLRSYSTLSNGTNAEFYRTAALGVEGVTSAAVVPREEGDGTVGVYIWSGGSASEGEPTAELIGKVSDKLNSIREINVRVIVKAAARRDINVSVYIKPAHGSTFEQAKVIAEEAVKKHFALKKIGDSTLRNKIGALLINLDAVDNYTLAANMSDFHGEPQRIHTLGTLNIMVMP